MKDLAAAGAMGQVNQPGHGDGAIAGFHFQQPGEGSALCIIQLRELLCQGVQLIEAAVSIKERFQFLKLRILSDIPGNAAVFFKAELVQCVQHRVRQGGEVQESVGDAIRGNCSFQVYGKNRLHIDCPPIRGGWSSSRI